MQDQKTHPQDHKVHFSDDERPRSDDSDNSIGSANSLEERLASSSDEDTRRNRKYTTSSDPTQNSLGKTRGILKNPTYRRSNSNGVSNTGSSTGGDSTHSRHPEKHRRRLNTVPSTGGDSTHSRHPEKDSHHPRHRAHTACTDNAYLLKAARRKALAKKATQHTTSPDTPSPKTSQYHPLTHISPPPTVFSSTTAIPAVVPPASNAPSTDTIDGHGHCNKPSNTLNGNISAKHVDIRSQIKRLTCGICG